MGHGREGVIEMNSLAFQQVDVFTAVPFKPSSTELPFHDKANGEDASLPICLTERHMPAQKRALCGLITATRCGGGSTRSCR
jgi:hypothetical protein